MSSRAFMKVQLRKAVYQMTTDIRQFKSTDVIALGCLMYRAYLNTVDYDGETEEQAIEEVKKTVNGDYGEFLPACSTVTVSDGTPVSATLVTRFQARPFIAFSFTDPLFQRRGFAKGCVAAAMTKLVEQGENELRLVVTRANSRAVELYQSLGFVFEEL